MEKIELSSQCDYGNLVPASLMKALIAVDAATAGVAALTSAGKNNKAASTVSKVFAGVGAASCGLTAYMQACRNAFDFNKGGLMGDIHQFVVDHLDWDGQGTVLDIGCGGGALSVRCAKAFPEARVLGIDTWGKERGYSHDQCVRNAIIEQVDDRTDFRKGDAAHLPLEDEAADAVVSSLAFTAVRSSHHKPDVVREALRVLKKGGSFAFFDLFGQKIFYGDMGDFLRELKWQGFSEVHYIPGAENFDGLVPKYIQTPWMIRDAGLLYGKK